LWTTSLQFASGPGWQVTSPAPIDVSSSAAADGATSTPAAKIPTIANDRHILRTIVPESCTEPVSSQSNGQESHQRT
jgi:hypothetical protein